jgi:hypothetical protein
VITHRITNHKGDHAMKNLIKGLAMGWIIGFMVFAVKIGHAQEPAMTPYGILYGSPETFAEFHGFVTLTYFDFEADGTRDGNSTFDQHYFYFNAIAKVRQNVTVFGEVEYEHSGEEIKLDRAFIDWRLIGELLALRLGQFYAPFGFELREYQYPVRKMTSRPMMARALLFNEWTEAGVNAYGRLGTGVVSVDYDIAVVNGPGEDGILVVSDPTEGAPNIGDTGDARQSRDNNNNRTVVGHLSVPVTHGPHKVGVGVSGATGRYSDSGTEELDFTLMGVDANFRMMGLDVRGEWVTRSVDVASSIDSSSYYLQASYRVDYNRDGLHYIEPVVRYDFLEPDEDTNDDERTRITLGLNYSPYPHFKFMAEWQMNDEDFDPDLDDDGFMASATVDF